MTEALRQRRLRDFRERAAYAPECVLRHRECGWAYIPVHPFGDDPETLTRLGLRPADCRVADAWWRVDDDATLLQASVGSPAGLYARKTDRPAGWVYLTVVIDAPFVTRTAFEAAMVRFAAIGFPGGSAFRLSNRAGLVRVGTLTAD